MWVPLLLVTVIAIPVPGNPAPPELQRLLGQPVIVEIPELEDLGSPLQVPEGWKYLQAKGETLDRLVGFLGVPPRPAVYFLDPYGNRLHEDRSSRRRSRLSSGVEEYERRVRALRERLQRAEEAAAKARRDGKEELEVRRLRDLIDMNARGYPETWRAVTRWIELEGERRRALLRILAQEGRVPRRRLSQRLEELKAISPGMEAEEAVDHELRRLDRGFTVREAPG